MKILIATPAYQFQVHTMMVDSLLKCMDFLREKGHQANWYTITGSAIAYARNLAADHAQKNGYDYLFFWDSDISIQGDFMDSILELAKQSSVVVLPYLMKGSQRQYAIHGKSEDGRLVNFAALPTTPFQVEQAATGAMLIDVSLFSKLSRPYFTFEDTYSQEPDFVPEDYYFCKKAREYTTIIAEPRFPIAHWGMHPFV